MYVTFCCCCCCYSCLTVLELSVLLFFRLCSLSFSALEVSTIISLNSEILSSVIFSLLVSLSKHPLFLLWCFRFLALLFLFLFRFLSPCLYFTSIYFCILFIFSTKTLSMLVTAFSLFCLMSGLIIPIPMF